MTTATEQVRDDQLRPTAARLRVTVVIPTYLRPTWLTGCLQSLVDQRRLPDEVIAVIRPDDWPTHEAFDRFLTCDATRGITFRKAVVREPGFLPPLLAGIRAATGDIVAFLDDDAEACPDWLERLLAPYTDPSVAGVGGRYLNHYDGREATYPPARRVGRFRWWGSFEGNMYRDLPTNGPRHVDFFMGGNMSYRRDALLRVKFDPALGNDVAFHYEVDLGQQIKRSAGRLIYDPLARIRHFSAPRARTGMRKPNSDTIFWYSHNTLYIAMKYSGAVQRWLAAAYSFAVGSSRAWGLASALVHGLRRRSLQSVRELRPAFAGKLRAIRSLRAQAGRAVLE